MRVLSPAKINLHLRVGPVQADGFHPLVSWMTTVGLFDTLEFSPDSGGQITLECDDPTLPTDGRNLVVRAAEALRTAASGSATPLSTGVCIRLAKAIPAGGGLGGGSGNAATTLVTLNRLWQLDLPANRLSQIAAMLGSDVAFFLHAPSAVCEGRGQIVTPVAAPRDMQVVLILPDLAMPTPAVYRQLDAMRSTAGAGDWNESIDVTRWLSLSVDQLLRELKNDLEAPAFALRPDLGELRGRIEQQIGRPVRMSGSGSTLFTLFDGQDFEGQDLAEMTAEKIRNEFSVRTINVPLAARV